MKKWQLLKLLIFILGSLMLLLILYWSVRLYLMWRSPTSFPLNLKWQVNLGSSSYDYPSYQDGLVLFPAEDNLKSSWYGLEAVTGRVVWSQPTGSYNFRRCLTKEHLVVSGPWSLIVLKTDTGEIIWKTDRGWTVACSENLVFRSGINLFISAFDISTGQQQWMATNSEKASFYGLAYNTEAGEIIAQENSLSEDFYIFDADSGTLKRSFKKIGHAPDNRSWERGPIYIIDRGQLFIENTVLDAQTGQVIHKEERYTQGATPPTLTADMIYISNPAGVAALNRTDFNIKWVYQPVHKVEAFHLSPLSSVVILDKVGYVIFADATLRAFDLETGQELGYWQLEWVDLWDWPVCTILSIFDCNRSARVGLAASEDILFVSFRDGKLYAFGRD